MSAKKVHALSEHSIRITLDGPDTEGGHVRASAFLDAIGNVVSLLRRLDMQDGCRGRASFYLRITDLSHSSPTQVVMEQCLLDPEVDRRDEVARRFFSMMEAIDAEDGRQHLDYGVLAAAKELSEPIGRTIKCLSISTRESEYSLDLGFRERLARKLAPEEKCYGTIKGMLEYINIHGKTHVFRIYPNVGPEEVACQFDSGILDQARAGIGKFVEVRGELRYKAISRYPHAISVKEISVIESAGAPDFDAVRGIFPDLTNGVAADVYVREGRSIDAE